MRDFLPPSAPRILSRVADRNARRLRRIRNRLRPGCAEHRESLEALSVTIRSWRGRDRRRFTLDPAVRSWLTMAEDALLLMDPPNSDTRWIDWLADSPYLSRVLPAGRIDHRARGRARSLGADLRARALGKLPILLAFMTPASSRRFGPFTLDPGPPDDLGEEERIPGEIHLPFPRPTSLIPKTPVRLLLTPGGARIIDEGGNGGTGTIPWTPLPTIPGSEIVLTRLVVSRARAGLAARGEVPGLADRFAGALDLVREAWPDAAREVESHTRRVVPFAEKGTVSFSRRTRPGVSYITTEGKSMIDLADDLVHETAHHRLHTLEEMGPIERDDGEPRYRSPWRGVVRPVRGLLHATYTFTYRVELFSRLLELRRRLPRRWLRSEIAREVTSLRAALEDLRDAQRRGLLTPAGARLRRAIAARVKAW